VVAYAEALEDSTPMLVSCMQVKLRMKCIIITIYRLSKSPDSVLNLVIKNKSLFHDCIKPYVMKYLYFLLCIGVLISTSQTTFAQSALSIGDDAPEFKIEQWIKNGGFTPLQKGKVYLVDLWATWCVPCVAGMPHLSQLQKKYKAKGLEVIGITSEDKYGNTLENVKSFVAKKDTLMSYNIAWVPVSVKDSEQGIWLHPWMQKSAIFRFL
jgi:thiol-disulfide isomerase/thioredoxin